MTRIGKLRELTAEQVSMALIDLDENGSWVPLLMPRCMVKFDDRVDDVIRAQADWLCKEYQEGDFGLWTVKETE